MKKNQKNKKIHILIPNYNRSKYIIHTVESVINQTYKNWQLTIIDNNSNDDSVNLIRKKFKKLIREGKIKVLKEKVHVSQGENWNRCIKNIGDYEYFKLLCSDDLIEKNHILNAVSKLDKTNSKIFGYSSSIRYISEDGNFLNKRKYGLFGLEFFGSLFFMNFIGTPSAMVLKTSQCKKIKFEEIPYTGDLIVFLNLYLKNKKVIFDKKIGCFFRIHKSSDTFKNYGSMNMLIGKKIMRSKIIYTSQYNIFFKIFLIVFCKIVTILEISYFRIRRKLNSLY